MALSNEQWNAPSAGGNFYEYQIANSLRGSAAGDTTLKFTAGTPTSTDVMTMSCWVKRHTPNSTNDATCNIFTTGTGGGAYFYMALSAGLNLENTGGNQGGGYLLTTEKFRDGAAWYHIILRVDTSQSTAFDRIRVYVNGQQLGLNSESGGSAAWRNQTMIANTAEDEDFSFLNADGLVQAIGGLSGKGHGTEGADLSIADFCFFDGQSFYDELGEYKNNVWIPKDPSGLTFGNNGYHLKFADASDIGLDSSGNGNDFTVANFAAKDVLGDSPTFGGTNGGNFPAFSPLFKTQSTNITDANLDFRSTGNIEGGLTSAIIPAGESTVYYFEAALTVSGGGHEVYFGVNALNIDMSGSSERGGVDEDTCWAIKLEPNQFAPVAGGTVGSNVSLTINTNDIVGMTVDRANRTIKWYINNTLKVTATDLYLTGDLAVWSGKGGGTTNIGLILNAGQDGTFAGTITAQGNADGNDFGNFYYAPPSGAVAYCAGNLPIAEGVDPAEDVDLSTLFQALLYTGNANNSRAITTQFDPDVMWIKRRDAAKAWNAYSKIQGIGSTSNYLDFSADDEIEPVSNSSNKGLLATSSTSMTVGAVDYINGNTMTYVAALFNLGNTQSTNNDGNLTSTIYANSAAGMSHGSYTGEGATKTVGHGLGVVPSFIIVKKTSADAAWGVYYGDNTDALAINTGAATADANFWADTTPSSSVFTVGNNAVTGEAADYVFWAYANTQGFIKAGSFTGNGNVDGTFIHTGFKPALLIIKRRDGAESWMFMDHSRDPSNVVEGVLQMNGTNGESTTDYDALDFLSNGFKMRINDAGFNHAEEYIFLAIAKNSFKYSTAG